jgi:hypothetical protein
VARVAEAQGKKAALLFRLGFATLPFLSGMKNDL